MTRAMLTALALWGCTVDKSPEEGDDTGESGDDTGAPPTYDTGCILVDGEGGYAWINDAVALASEGSTIDLCSAEAHEEAVVVDKAVIIAGPGASLFTLVPPAGSPGFTVVAAGATIKDLSVSIGAEGVLVDGAAQVTLEDLVVPDPGTWGISAVGSDDLVLDGVEVSGALAGGVSVSGGSATLSATKLGANTGWGLYVAEGAVVEVDGGAFDGNLATEPDDPEDGAGIGVEDAILVSTGGGFEDNALAGIYADHAVVTVEAGTFQGGTYGIWADDTELSVTDVELTDAWMGGIFANGDTVSLGSITVKGDLASVVELTVDEWLASNGIPKADGAGIAVEADSLAVADVSVEGYNNGGLVLKAKRSTGSGTVARVVLDGNGYLGLFTRNLDLSVSDLVVTGLREVQSLGSADTQCAQYWPCNGGLVVIGGDVVLDGYTATDPQGDGLAISDATVSIPVAVLDSTDPVVLLDTPILDFTGRYGAVYCENSTSVELNGGYVLGTMADYGVYGVGCSGVLDGFDIDSVAEVGLAAMGGDWTVTDVDIGDAGVGIYMEPYDGDFSLALQDVSISDTTASYGVYVTGGATAASRVSADGLTVTNGGTYPVYLDNVDLDLDGVTVTGTSTYGLYLDEVTGRATAVSVTGSRSRGVRVAGSTLELSGAVLASSEGEGMTASDSTVTIDGSTITGSADEGLVLDGCSATVTNNTITGSGLVGMACTDTTISDCSGNDLSGNAGGEQTGCGEECGEDAFDPGGDDTGGSAGGL